MRSPSRRLLLGLPGLGLFAGSGAFAREQDPYERTQAVYAALAQQPGETLDLDGSWMTLVFADEGKGLDRSLIKAWIRSSAEAVIHYFGRFPVKQVGLLVIADDSARVSGGTTFGFDRSAIRIHVGRGADEATFRRDWIMTHELTHLALPIVPTRSWWMLEGSATYVEPFARLQVGQLTAANIWGGMMRGMPNGLPGPDDRGLDITRTWGRTYWGGAIFCLQADIGIRRETQGRLGLQDAFRAINRDSDGNTARWSMDTLVATGDRATGTRVLTDLYAASGSAAVPVDLNALFADLGVRMRDDKIAFDDSAPLAEVRLAIERGTILQA